MDRTYRSVGDYVGDLLDGPVDEWLELGVCDVRWLVGAYARYFGRFYVVFPFGSGDTDGVHVVALNAMFFVAQMGEAFRVSYGTVMTGGVLRDG